MGGLPPIQFVPEARPKQAESGDETKRVEKKTVETKINGKLKKIFPIFVEGDAEAVIQLIRDHESILEDTKLRELYDASLALINAKKTQISSLDATRDKDQIQTLSDDIKELIATCKSVQAEAFDCFEKLLDRTLVSKWREIVCKQCDTCPYINLNGKKMSNKPRGRVFAAFKPC